MAFLALGLVFATMIHIVSTRFFVFSLCLAVLVTFLGLHIFNAYGQATTTSSTVNISLEIPNTSGFPTTPAPGTTIILPAPGNAALVFEGFTSPNALIYFYGNGSLLATDKAALKGTFARTLLVNSGISNFGIASKDKAGLLTSTSNLSLNIISYSTTTVSNILLSPTLQTENSVVQKGMPVHLSGSVFPESTVFVLLDGMQIAEVLAKGDGFWRYSLATRNLTGHHVVGAKAIIRSLGLISAPSPTVSLVIKEGLCSGPDLNQDGMVDIADLSIMLFYWREQNPQNQCVDLNLDGLVNIADLSLLMYAWTGNHL